MKQDQRKKLIQAMATGDINTVQELNTELNGTSVPFDDILPSAHYLLEYGEPVQTRALPKNVFYHDCEPEDQISSLEDIACLEAGLRVYAETGTFEHVDLKPLKHMCVTMQCYLILKNEDQLEQLDKYRHLINFKLF